MNLHDLFDGSIGGAIVAVVWIIVHVWKSKQGITK
jgi:hypothetical protein